MEWSKLLSDYYEDGAVVAVGEEGEVLFLRSIAWSSKKDLCGLVPSWQLDRFGLKNAARRAAKLVEQELWTVVEGGWQITNYAAFAPSDKEIARDELHRTIRRLRSALAYQLRRGLRDELISQAGRCARCASTHSLAIDHIKPLIQGGTNARSNLQVLCKTCNSSKGGRF